MLNCEIMPKLRKSLKDDFINEKAVIEDYGKYNLNVYKTKNRNIYYDKDTGIIKESIIKKSKFKKGYSSEKRWSNIVLKKTEELDGDGHFLVTTGYLRESPKGKTVKEINNEKINPDNKIFTLNLKGSYSNKKKLVFYTTHPKIGLDRDIQIIVDENNIATLQTIDGKETVLTDGEINKIKEFFKNIPIEQLDSFEPYLAMLYYTTIMNKEEYKDTNILIPDVKYKYGINKNKEVELTLQLIKDIPQDKRKGKYISPIVCLNGDDNHQVNLKIDFDNKICEIVNTGKRVKQEVINNLQKELRNQFDENWKAYENHKIYQSTGNCGVAPILLTVEKEILENEVNKYKDKERRFKEVDQKYMHDLFPNHFEDIKDKKHNIKDSENINKDLEQSDKTHNNNQLTQQQMNYLCQTMQQMMFANYCNPYNLMQPTYNNFGNLSFLQQYMSNMYQNSYLQNYNNSQMLNNVQSANKDIPVNNKQRVIV